MINIKKKNLKIDNKCEFEKCTVSKPSFNY